MRVKLNSSGMLTVDRYLGGFIGPAKGQSPGYATSDTSFPEPLRDKYRVVLWIVS